MEDEKGAGSRRQESKSAIKSNSEQGAFTVPESVNLKFPFIYYSIACSSLAVPTFLFVCLALLPF